MNNPDSMHNLLEAYRLLGNAAEQLELAARNLEAKGPCARGIFNATANTKEAQAKTEELAHLAATGKWL